MNKSQSIDKNLLAVSLDWLLLKQESIQDNDVNCNQLIFTKNIPIKLAKSKNSFLITSNYFLLNREKISNLSLDENSKLIFFFSEGITQSVDEGLFELSPLLKCLFDYVLEIGYLSDANEVHKAVYTLINSCILKAKARTFSVAIPKDARTSKLYQLLVVERQFDENLDELAKKVGASARTIERLLEAEIGMNFSNWRRIMQMQLALSLLAQGKSITEIAMEVGYKSSSAFINVFKKQMGVSPKKYLKK